MAETIGNGGSIEASEPGAASVELKIGSLLDEGAQSVEAQGALIDPDDITAISDKLLGLHFIPIPNTPYSGGQGFEVSIPASERARLSRGAHPSPETGVEVVDVGGRFRVVNPGGLANGADRKADTTAREATLKFSPENPTEIVEDLTTQSASNPNPSDPAIRDGQAVWAEGVGRVEVVMIKKSGAQAVVRGNVVGSLFGAGSTITYIGADGKVGQTIDLAGSPAVFKISTFRYDGINRKFTADHRMKEVYVWMRAADGSQLDVSIGGPTSFVDTDGPGTADFRDAGFPTLSEPAGVAQPPVVGGQG